MIRCVQRLKTFKDPLNLPVWRRWLILLLVTFYAALAVLLATGMGSIFPIIRAAYPGQEAKVNDLTTMPALFMGIGNFISMPLALTIGRRPVFLFSVALLAGSSLWCALSTSLDSHIAGRNFLSMAAGQSEALVPLMVQEIFFLHERSAMLGWFMTIQNILGAGCAMGTTYMVAEWGWRWWYGFFAAILAAHFVVSVLFVSETAFDRPQASFTGQHEEMTEKEHDAKHLEVVSDTEISSSTSVERKYAAWSIRNLRPITKKQIVWSQLPLFYKHFVQGLCVPSITWLFLLNGAFLSLYVFQASTFAQVLLSPPYLFSFEALGYVQAAQVVGTAVFLPVLGYGSDWIIKFMSKRRGGVYSPEYRLIPLWIPAITGIICAVMYGQCAAKPSHYSWGSVAFTYNATFFGFLGANIVGITYAIDAFPQRAGALLVIICAGRGLVSFGMAYATLPAITAIGYDGAMNVEASICAVFTVMAIPIYIYGQNIRNLADKWFKFGPSASAPSRVVE